MDESIFKDIIDNANDVIVITDTEVEEPGPRILYVNRAFTELTGYSAEEVIGKSPRILQGSDTSSLSRERIKTFLKRFEPIRIEIVNYAKSGKKYWLDLSIVPLKVGKEYKYFAAIERDMTRVKDIQENLKTLASKDPLTNVYNHRAFYEKAELVMDQFERHQKNFTLILVDIDDFKEINDSKGHLYGDEILIKLAKVLVSNFRKSDVIARYGGDEFVVVMPNASLVDLKPKLEKLIDLNIGISIGATQVTKEDRSIEEVIDRADDLLYQSKESGKNKYCIG